MVIASVADTEFASLRDRLLRLLASGPRESVGPDILGFDIDQPSQADSQGYVAFERAMMIDPTITHHGRLSFPQRK